MADSCCEGLGKGHVNADVRRGCFEGVGGKVWLTAAAWGWARAMSDACDDFTTGSSNHHDDEWPIAFERSHASGRMNRPKLPLLPLP